MKSYFSRNKPTAIQRKPQTLQSKIFILQNDIKVLNNKSNHTIDSLTYMANGYDEFAVKLANFTNEKQIKSKKNLERLDKNLDEKQMKTD